VKESRPLPIALEPASSPISVEVPLTELSVDASAASTLHVQAPPAALKVRVINFIAIVTPLLGLIAACVMLWGTAFSWTYLALLVSMFILTGAGITIGFHRLFTHRSFECPAWVRFIFGVLGSMAVQGPLLHWVAEHRRHHQHSDHDGDPHSPHGHGETWGDMIRGAWHSHVGWMFKRSSRDLPRYVKDLRKDPVCRIVNRQFPLWVLVGLIIPAIAGGLLTMSWMGVLLGFLWGGLARVFLVHHVTWSVNSVCHLWGARPFESHDHSRNNLIVGVLALGEGWHNNHHAFPTSARHGLAWWEVDFSYLVIRGLAAIGLARNVRVPDSDRIARKRRRG
jgi:stearoyl-CoA desaturase (delta-9 desaturase)